MKGERRGAFLRGMGAIGDGFVSIAEGFASIAGVPPRRQPLPQRTIAEELAADRAQLRSDFERAFLPFSWRGRPRHARR